MSNDVNNPAHSTTPLMEAVLFPDAQESIAWAERLLESGEDPNLNDLYHDCTPFEAAWDRGFLPLMKLLVKHGADPMADLSMFEGISIANNPISCSEYMLSVGHRFDQLVESREGELVYSCGTQPLTYLLAQERWDYIEHFRSHGLLDLINVIEETSEETPLIEMVLDRRFEQAKWLLDNGASPNTRWQNRVCNTALDHAVENQDLGMIKLLSKHGADPSIETWMSITALLRAERRFKEAKDYTTKQHAKMILIALNQR